MKYRILIVEDEEAIAKMVELNLILAGYDVCIYDNGLTAAKALKKDHAFDLAILDIMLPGMDGFSLQEQISGYQIPVLFLTAKDDISSKIKGLKNGAEDYMVKPFEVLELLVRIENILKRYKKDVKEIHILDMDINLEEHSVKKDGVEILLKPKEYELLVVLAKNKNMAISREQLLRSVWGVDYLGETRTVDVHIGQLRKKLKLNEQIKTISKMGYRLEG